LYELDNIEGSKRVKGLLIRCLERLG